MSLLGLLLIAKIAVTFVAVAVPFLVLSRDRIARLSGYEGAPIVLIRLYAVAVLALLVGYGGGLRDTLAGTMPWAVIVMGIVSNAGAATVLVAYGEGGRRPLLTAFFSAVALGLLAAAMMPERALQPV